DPERRVLSGCLDRQSRTIDLLLNRKGQINITHIMKILREHGPKFQEKPFIASKGTMSSICGHMNSKTIHQTTASYVAHLLKDLQIHWLTGTSAPCLSIFKPFSFNSPDSLKTIQIPSLKNDNVSLWWKHEKLHREIIMDYEKRAPIVIKKNQELEQELINRIKNTVKKVNSINQEELKLELNEISTKALEQNFSLIEHLYEKISQMEIEKSAPKGYIKFWMALNKEVGLV
ncbi:MAG: hypothetical protein ACFFCM_07180, partial [Promethearchaeota archaeon]